MSSETPSTTPDVFRSDHPDPVPQRFQVPPRSAADSLDPNLVTETKNQIRELAQEIRDLAGQDGSRDEFYQGFLARTISALASVGGAIWLRNSQGKMQLEYQANLSQTNIPNNEEYQQQHGRLLDNLLQTGQPALVPPRTGNSNDDQATSNPTDYLLVVGTLTTENEVDGLVEIFQRPGGGPATQRGYLRFLTQMCDIASNFLKNQRLKDFSEQQQTWNRLEKFVHHIHRGLNVQQTLYSIANEGRQFVDCDRVSVALMRGNACKIQAVSGLDSIERRAEQIKRLSRLTTAVTRTDGPLWYDGDDSQLAPQIEKRLQEYVDLSHAKMISILPLHSVPPGQPANEAYEANVATAGANRRRQKKRPCIGAVIFEQLGDDKISPALNARAEAVQLHSSDALTNSIAHNRIFLLPLLKALGAVPGVGTARRIPKWMFALATLAIVAAAMQVVPYEFALGAHGKLVPETRYEIYAPSNGILKEIYVSDDPDVVVEKNQLLALMTNNDLLVEIESLQGQLKTEIEQQKKLNRAMLEKLDRIDQLELVGEINKSIHAEKSIRRKLELKNAELKRLEIRAPERGQVVNWQIRQSLIRRPVQPGQNLMTVVDPDTQWLLEMELPERRVEHLMKQQRSSDEPITVSFNLASHPGKTFSGSIVEMDRQLDVHSEDGNAVLVRVAFDKSTVPEELLRAGTRVTAKIHCGERSVGYVLFHELIETVQTKVMFWF